MRYEWVDRNPIKLVRQSAKRERIPDVLELAEIRLLLSKLSVRERTLALLDAGTGLRVSELLGLWWRDVDFENLELGVIRVARPSLFHLRIRNRHPGNRHSGDASEAGLLPCMYPAEPAWLMPPSCSRL
jgi:integrase